MQLSATIPAEPGAGVERCPLCHDGLRGPALHVVRCWSCETPHHQSCVQEFAGCGTIGCQRRSTSPRGPKGKIRIGPARPVAEADADAEQPKGGWIGAVGSLVFAWLTVPIVWPLGFVGTLLMGAGLAGTGRKRPALLTLLLSPVVALPILSVFVATATYWTGSASIGSGERHLDPLVRCPVGSRGCLVDGSEVLTDFPHDLTLKSWGSLCGPMPGAYSGPLPTEAEALELLREERVVVSGAAIERGMISLGSLGIELDCHQLPYPSIMESDGSESVWAAVYQERCLVLAGETWIEARDMETGQRLVQWETHWYSESWPLSKLRVR